MARTSKPYGKNNWALFLLILVGIMLGSLIGYLTKEINFLSWLNKGIYFSIGDSKNSNIVTLDLDVLVLHFGISIKITVGSVLGTIGAIFMYKKL
jgi:hypothetical protein